MDSYKIVFGCSNYEINRYSEIRNKTSKQVKKAFIDKKGYSQIRLRHDLNGWKSFKVHRLMALTFLDNPLNLREVNHIDGNKSNNKLDNLEWISSGDNQRHAYRLGLSKGNKKRTPEMDLKIDELIKEGQSHRKIGRSLNLSNSTVSYYLKKKNHQ